MAYAMFVNLFLLGAEVFKEYYSATEHLRFTQYLWSGIGEHRALVPFAWLSLVLQRGRLPALPGPGHPPQPGRRSTSAALLIWAGVYIEKGMGLVIPGMTPDTLGEIYEYRPTLTEWSVAAGIFGIGFLVFTVLVKVAVPIMTGAFQARTEAADEASPAVPVPHA